MKLEDILTNKDRPDKNGIWVIVCDAELWERTGIQNSTQPQPAHTDMAKDEWTPDQTTMYRAGEHWVTTTEPFKVTTPKEEYEKIQKRQQEIYWQIVTEQFEERKTTFLRKLNEVPNKKEFLGNLLEQYQSFELPKGFIYGEREFDKIIPIHLEEDNSTDNGHVIKVIELNLLYPPVAENSMKRPSENYLPKVEAYDKFGQWLKEYQLFDNTLKSSVISIESEEEDLTIREICISPENIEPIYNALIPYFKGQETKLRQLLEGKSIEGKIRFNESAKVLCNTFNTLHEAGKIGATIEQIKVWLRKYFQANRKPFNLTENTTNRNFQEKIERHGQILMPTIKSLITFDKP